jgi:hypothetical protein
VTFDFDDAWPGHDRLDSLRALRAARPDFRCTLFAVPARCDLGWCESLPDWIELAVHGWNHDSVYECADWTRADLARVLDENIVRDYFVQGFKAPGWQISDACYEELKARDWWVADQHLEDERRPPMRVYFYEDGGWHGHIQNVCGNGIEETWGDLVGAVQDAQEFRFCSEAARFHPDPDDPGTRQLSS